MPWAAAHDPACPAFCEFLEQDGLRFCGLRPFGAGREDLVFGRFETADLEPQAFCEPAVRSLVEYVARTPRPDFSAWNPPPSSKTSRMGAR